MNEQRISFWLNDQEGYHVESGTYDKPPLEALADFVELVDQETETDELPTAVTTMLRPAIEAGWTHHARYFGQFIFGFRNNPDPA
jgi:hypothetical protein